MSPRPNGRARQRQEVVLVPPVVSGRVPPHDLDAEAAVLSACLLTPEVSIDAAATLLKPRSFYSESNQAIFRSILRLHEEGRHVDVVTVAGDLRGRELIQKVGGTDYLGRITDATPAVHHVEEHARIVLQKWRMREMIATCQLYAGEGYGDVGDEEQWLATVERGVLKAAQSGRRHEMVSMRTLATRAHKRIAEPDNDADRPRFVTGLEAFDAVVGTLRGGHLVILAARPGMGKSALLSKLGILLSSRYGYVAEFHLELDKDEAMDRKVAQRSWVALNLIENPKELSDAQHSRTTEALEELSRLPIELDDTPALTLREVQAKARAVAQHARRERERRIAAGESLEGMASPNGMGAVLIDYVQLMRWQGEARSRDEAIGYITRGLKELAKELKCPVIALSQLNRGVETRGGKDKRPGLADLRESGNLEQDADKVVFIYRESYYDADADKRRAELICAKNRGGKTGVLEIGWAPWCVDFHDLGEGP